MKYIYLVFFLVSINSMELQQVVVDHPTITINEIHKDCEELEKMGNKESCCSTKIKTALIAGGSSVLSAGLAVLVTVLASKKCD
jgi:hypothetical protein